MSSSAGELLLKAIRSLPEDEQERLLGRLLDQVVDAPAPAAVPRDVLRRLPADLVLSGPPPVPQPVLQPLGHLPPIGEDTGLKVLPVRLPAGDYERLKAWSKQHDFSMAVIVRTLVERFLDQQSPAGT